MMAGMIVDMKSSPTEAPETAVEKTIAFTLGGIIKPMGLDAAISAAT